MRKTCFECVIKHLGSAGVADMEFHMGYPQFKLWVIGNLEHASQEVYDEYPEFAMVIREHRLRWQDTDGDYRIPYEALASFADDCSRCRHSTAEQELPEIPDDCIFGLKTENGKPVFTRDTRP